jgi:ATP-binding cassette subfamily B protein/subfamily B ATP-binding cassette protein MsbA
MQPQTSKSRYQQFLEQRRAGALEAKKTEPDNKPVDWTRDRGDPLKSRTNRSFSTLLREFLKLLRGHRAIVSLCLLSAVIVGGLMVVNTALTTKIVFDYVLLDSPGPKGLPDWLHGYSRVQLMMFMGAGMVALALLMALLGTWSRYQLTRLTQLLRADVRRRTFRHMQRLPLHKLYALKSGGIASIVREDAASVAELLFQLLYNPLRSVITFVGGLVMMAIIDWKLLLAGLAMGPMVWFSHRTWIARIRPIHRSIKNSRTGTDAHATEAFGGSRVVRAFGRQSGELNRFARNTHLMTRQELLAWWWMRGIEVVWVVLGPTVAAAALTYGGWQIVKGNMTIGDVVAFTTYMFMLLGPMETLVSVAATMQTNLAGFDRILDVWAEPTELDAGQTPDGTAPRWIERQDVRARVTLENLSFKYPNSDKYVLQEISLDVQPGETIALVGSSGSGKTTLCNLVARFFDPTSGAIKLDGIDLRKIDVRAYRKCLGIVEQDVFLFDGTVSDNIGYARRDVDQEKIVAAARAANAHEFISQLEHGYDTIIGERGVRLSGGQKQRIAIARAILADPRVLILDEATSNLDSESEALIQRSLVELMRNRTSFVIAHRLSTIRHASRIVVLEGGRIVELGTHDQLTAQGGRYWKMLRTQLDPASIDEPIA